LGGYYPCDATYTHPGDTSGTVFHNWTTANLGMMNLARAITISCDTVFDRFGSDFYTRYVQNQLSDSGLLLQNDLREFGFGTPTGPSSSDPRVTAAARSRTPRPIWPTSGGRWAR